MRILMKRPLVGQKIKSAELGITGRVTAILSYEDAFAWLPESQKLRENERLFEELGDDFRARYFEVAVHVHYATKASGYRRGEDAVLDWQEFQGCDIL